MRFSLFTPFVHDICSILGRRFAIKYGRCQNLSIFLSPPVKNFAILTVRARFYARAAAARPLFTFSNDLSFDGLPICSAAGYRESLCTRRYVRINTGKKKTNTKKKKNALDAFYTRRRCCNANKSKFVRGWCDAKWKEKKCDRLLFWTVFDTVQVN